MTQPLLCPTSRQEGGCWRGELDVKACPSSRNSPPRTTVVSYFVTNSSGQIVSFMPPHILDSSQLVCKSFFFLAFLPTLLASPFSINLFASSLCLLRFQFYPCMQVLPMAVRPPPLAGIPGAVPEPSCRRDVPHSHAWTGHEGHKTSVSAHSCLPFS